MSIRSLAVIPHYFGSPSRIIRTAQLLSKYSFLVLLYDNSFNITKQLFPHSFNLNVISPSTNEGVYGAYRYAFSLVQQEQYSHLLLLDQDSLLSTQYLDQFIQLSSTNLLQDCVYAPYDHYNLILSKEVPAFFNSIHSQLLDAKGSGLILPKKLCVCNYLDPTLCLDYLDWALCWNLTSKGFSIYQLKESLFSHSLGSPVHLPCFPNFALRISTPSRIVNQLKSSIYLLTNPYYIRIIPFARKIKLFTRIPFIPFLLLFSVFFQQFRKIHNVSD